MDGVHYHFLTPEQFDEKENKKGKTKKIRKTQAERMGEEVAALFPDARTLVLSSDFPGGAERLRRDRERLGRSDEGIILYRNLLKEQVAKVQRGEDPMNVFRDPAAAECIEIVTEHDHARIPGGPTQKYSPIRKTVLELGERDRGVKA